MKQKPQPLEQKIYQELGKHRYNSHGLDGLLDIVDESEELSNLFKEISQNPKLLRLLTLHRLDLFGFDTQVKLPFLLCCSLPKGATNESSVSSALKYIVNGQIDNVEDAGLTLISDMIGNENQTEFIIDLQDISYYFLIQFLRNNPRLISLANGEKFNFQIMKKELKNYSETINLKDFANNLFTNNLDPNVVDPAITERIEKIVLNVVSNLLSKVEDTLDNTQSLIPDLKMYFHTQAIIWLSALLSKTELKFEEYLDQLDILFRFKCIENKHTVSWCDSCNKVDSLFTTLNGNIVPSSVNKKQTCIRCQNKKFYSYSAIYSIEVSLKEIINSKDGLLATYFAWLLEKNGFDFECSKFASQYETDILIEGKYLVECKLFRVDKDDNRVKENIKKAFTQLENHIQKLKEDGIIITKAFLLWNLDITDKDLQSFLDTNFAPLRKQYSFKIISINECQDAIHNLKTTQ